MWLPPTGVDIFVCVFLTTIICYIRKAFSLPYHRGVPDLKDAANTILSPDGSTIYRWVAKRGKFITGRRTATFDTIVDGVSVQRVDHIV